MTNAFVTSTTEATARYKKNGSAFCTGDTQMTGLEGDSSVVKTVVTVRAPSANPYAPLEGTPICTLTLPGWDTSTPASALDNDAATNVLARTYHRWSNLMQGCVNPIVSAGDDYSIQIQTFGGGGQNRFALRAYYGSPGSGSGADVSIFAVDRVSLFNNVTAGTSYFNLVRLDNSARNHVLNVRFYDMGDSEPCRLWPQSCNPMMSLLSRIRPSWRAPVRVRSRESHGLHRHGDCLGQRRPVAGHQDPNHQLLRVRG